MELEEQPPMLYYLFCKWCDEEAGPQKRDYIFSRPDNVELASSEWWELRTY
jgi:hypothetical protein